MAKYELSKLETLEKTAREQAHGSPAIFNEQMKKINELNEELKRARALGVFTNKQKENQDFDTKYYSTKKEDFDGAKIISEYTDGHGKRQRYLSISALDGVIERYKNASDSMEAHKQDPTLEVYVKGSDGKILKDFQGNKMLRSDLDLITKSYKQRNRDNADDVILKVLALSETLPDVKYKQLENHLYAMSEKDILSIRKSKNLRQSLVNQFGAKGLIDSNGEMEKLKINTSYSYFSESSFIERAREGNNLFTKGTLKQNAMLKGSTKAIRYMENLKASVIGDFGDNAVFDEYVAKIVELADMYIIDFLEHSHDPAYCNEVSTQAAMIISRLDYSFSEGTGLDKDKEQYEHDIKELEDMIQNLEDNYKLGAESPYDDYVTDFDNDEFEEPELVAEQESELVAEQESEPQPEQEPEPQPEEEPEPQEPTFEDMINRIKESDKGGRHFLTSDKEDKKRELEEPHPKLPSEPENIIPQEDLEINRELKEFLENPDNFKKEEPKKKIKGRRQRKEKDPNKPKATFSELFPFFKKQKEEPKPPEETKPPEDSQQPEERKTRKEKDPNKPKATFSDFFPFFKKKK